MKSGRVKIPRGKCRYCGRRKYTPGVAIIGNWKAIQGVCLKCLKRIENERIESNCS